MTKKFIKLQKLKVKRVIICFLLLFISTLLLIPNSLANPVYITPVPDLTYAIILFVIFFVNIIIEYIVIFLFLEQEILNPLKLFKSVFVVNFFTFPVTQLIALTILFNFPFTFEAHLTAEFFPLIFETLLYFKINKILNRNGDLSYPIPRKKTIVYTITANLITFSIGLLLFIPFTMSYYLIPILPP